MNQGKMILWMAVPGLLLAALGVVVYKYYKLKNMPTARWSWWTIRWSS